MAIRNAEGDEYISWEEVCDLFDKRSKATFHRKYRPVLERLDEPICEGKKKYYSRKSVQLLQKLFMIPQSPEDSEVIRKIMILVRKGTSPKTQDLEMPKRWKPDLGDQK